MVENSLTKPAEVLGLKNEFDAGGRRSKSTVGGGRAERRAYSNTVEFVTDEVEAQHAGVERDGGIEVGRKISQRKPTIR